MQDKLRRLIGDMHYQYPTGATTMGNCPNNCGNKGRGSNKCGYCLEKEIAALTSNGVAARYHMAVIELMRAKAGIENFGEEND